MFNQGRFYLGHLGQVPVYIAPEAVFMLLLLWMWSDHTLPGFLILVMALITVILSHEFSHAAVARWRGMSGVSITIAALGGFCSYQGQRRPLNELLISLAGPFGNFLTAGILYAFTLWVMPFERFDPMIAKFLIAVMFMSFFLGLFNLLPIYPLDGGQATLAASRMVVTKEANARRFTLSLAVVTAFAVFAGYVSFIGQPSLFTIIILGLLLFSAFRDLR
jgi:Zn-dependent protease